MHKDGEPLLDKLLFKRIDYIKENLKNSEVGLNSNAMLMDEEKARKICESGLDTISFSVDGASKQTYEYIRVNLNYDVVKKNIEISY